MEWLVTFQLPQNAGRFEFFYSSSPPLASGYAGLRASSMVDLGYCYEHGLGVSKDDAIASRWYLKAAHAGDAVGMRNIGLNLAYGRGVPQNYTAGIAWIERSAAAGNQDAKKQLVALPKEMRARQLNLVLGSIGSAMKSSSDSGGDDHFFRENHDNDAEIRKNQEARIHANNTWRW